MDDLQHTLQDQLRDPTNAAWLPYTLAVVKGEYEDLLAYELEFIIEWSRLHLFAWNWLTALAAVQRDLKPKQQAVLPASFYSWCSGVAAGLIRPPTARGRPRHTWRNAFIRSVIRKYRTRGVPLERAFELVAAVSGLTAKSVKGIWLATDTKFEVPPMSATVAQQFAELLG